MRGCNHHHHHPRHQRRQPWLGKPATPLRRLLGPLRELLRGQLHRRASEVCLLELLPQPEWARLQALKQALLACSLDLRLG